jgi:UDP-N-acetylmuramate dehydrogenase
VTTFGDRLRHAFGPDRVVSSARLKDLTTFHVGGPADWLVETRSTEEIVLALAIARAAGVPVTILGGGSNVLVADRGIRGVVIRPRGGHIARVEERWLRADAAVTINGLVRWTIVHGVAGLASWAGTPGTVGGAIWGNAHFLGRHIGDSVVSSQLVDRTGTVQDVPALEMAFGYDDSRPQRTGEVVLSATFRVHPGESAALRAEARQSLAYRKRTQPLDVPSAGCVFRNPGQSAGAAGGEMPPPAGALVDRAGLKGFAIGGARVSPTHGNFIVNDGTASAADIRRLIEHCRRTVRERFGVELKEEIVYLGQFDQLT